MYKTAKNRYFNNGGQPSLSQLGQPSRQPFAAPPEEYMTYAPSQKPKFRQPAPRTYKSAPKRDYAKLNKEARRKQWLQKRKDKRMGLSQLYRNG